MILREIHLHVLRLKEFQLKLMILKLIVINQGQQVYNNNSFFRINKIVNLQQIFAMQILQTLTLNRN